LSSIRSGGRAVRRAALGHVGYVFQYVLTAPKGLKLGRVSVLEGDLERAHRWSQGDDGTFTVFP